MSYFRDCVAARDYFQRFIDLGLGTAQPVLDRRVALLDAVFGANHCKESYESEKNGTQNAPEYRP